MSQVKFVFDNSFLNLPSRKYFDFIENNEDYFYCKKIKDRKGNERLVLDDTMIDPLTYQFGEISQTIANFVKNIAEFSFTDAHNTELGRGNSYAIDANLALKAKDPDNVKKFRAYLSQKNITDKDLQTLILALLLQAKCGTIGLPVAIGSSIAAFMMDSDNQIIKDNYILQFNDPDLTKLPIFDITDLKSDGSVDIMLQLPCRVKDINNNTDSAEFGKLELKLTINKNLKVNFGPLLLTLHANYLQADWQSKLTAIQVRQANTAPQFSIPKLRKQKTNVISATITQFFTWLKHKLLSQAPEQVQTISAQREDAYLLTPDAIDNLVEQYKVRQLETQGLQHQKASTRLYCNMPIDKIAQQKNVNLHDIYNSKIELGVTKG